MYQYIQGWKIDKRDLDWALGFSDWSKGLDLYGRRVWVEFDGEDCVVRRLWYALSCHKASWWLEHGYYEYKFGDTVLVIYRFDRSMNRNQRMDRACNLETLIGIKWPTRIRLIKNLDKSCGL